MHILLTGASGLVGHDVLIYLLSQGHTVLATDIVPLPDHILSKLTDAIPDLSSKFKYLTVDLCSHTAVQQLFDDAQATTTPIEGVIHLGAIPNPLNRDARVVHNNNVTSSYNVLYTAAKMGIKRITQASSVNATGLSYTTKGRQMYDEFPLSEEKETYKGEDPYALSKEICETQARSIVRLFPGTRVASLRFHMVVPSLSIALPKTHASDLWAWVSVEASARACLLGITSEGWEGAEAFNIVADDIAWEGGLAPESKGQNQENGKHVTSLELAEHNYKGRYGGIREGWWVEGRERRGFWDCTKAERLLGWKHDQQE
ncbi:hypothetical protein CI109_100534 [Kwoniella shandongensis]|uniref:Uncharacterized protein n=1 Tax=Kwoniella shandongensis TaxID=1734106 RepID=A0A5M6BZH0_9TREE|nr:uncharacterized protein CI109_003545 [Kwoniella shandongensis]KAA5528256.1 hypothetical protein CI109_003545 [Kwoniella shandongensis]